MELVLGKRGSHQSELMNDYRRYYNVARANVRLHTVDPRYWCINIVFLNHVIFSLRLFGIGMVGFPMCSKRSMTTYDLGNFRGSNSDLAESESFILTKVMTNARIIHFLMAEGSKLTANW